eukprot:4811756-Prymnesium_polylepis.1
MLFGRLAHALNSHEAHMWRTHSPSQSHKASRKLAAVHTREKVEISNVEHEVRFALGVSRGRLSRRESPLSVSRVCRVCCALVARVRVCALRLALPSTARPAET